MTLIRQRSFLIPAAMLAAVAILGSSLGLMSVKALNPEPLFTGTNYVGGRVQSGTTLAPEDWTACLPANQWTGIYTFDNATKLWSHYFNPVTTGVPDYVNEIGGISGIRFSTAVVVVATQNIPGATFPATQAEANTCAAPD